jgi:hypothetical protein
VDSVVYTRSREHEKRDISDLRQVIGNAFTASPQAASILVNDQPIIQRANEIRREDGAMTEEAGG